MYKLVPDAGFTIGGWNERLLKSNATEKLYESYEGKGYLLVYP